MSVTYSIEKLDSQRVNETADLVVTTFNEREPLAGLNQAPPEEFSKFILNLTQQCADEELGFDEKAFIKYSDFTFDGEKPFSPITEHEGIKLLIKRL